jgi:hypothetical protein
MIPKKNKYYTMVKGIIKRLLFDDKFLNKILIVDGTLCTIR